MNAGKDIIKSEHLVLAKTKERTQTMVGRKLFMFQIPYPQT
jgi:hypothetical protein